MTSAVEVIIAILALGLAIGVHEAAHAWVADKLGDPTAKLMGRTTINPLAHLDPVGTLTFVITYFLFHAPFGWGKPVPVNEARLRRKYDVIWVALAGPASNLIAAIIFGILYRLFAGNPFQAVLLVFIVINLSLMLFNLVPIPPLDGSKLLRLFLPLQTYIVIEQYGFILILALLLLGQGILGTYLGQGLGFFFHLLTGTSLSL